MSIKPVHQSILFGNPNECWIIELENLKKKALIMRKIKWGILSTAKIGIQKVIPAMQRAALCDVIAIASSNKEKVKKKKRWQKRNNGG